MFFVTIVVLPANLKMIKATSVSFLGPILEKTAFDLMLNPKEQNKGVFFDPPKYAKSDFSSYAQEGSRQLKFNTEFSTLQKEGAAGTQGLLQDFKVMPPPSKTPVEEKRPAGYEGPPAAAQDNSLRVEGLPAGREVVYKPGLPDIPPRIGSSQKSFTVELKFEVLPDGRVNEVSPLASSGYPDIDLAAMGFIREVKFSPLRESEDQKPVWGSAKISIESR